MELYIQKQNKYSCSGTTTGSGGVGATHSDADFAKDLLRDLAGLLQRLVQGAAVLQPAGKGNMKSLYWKDSLKFKNII